jgi:hypothetical protein
MNYCSEEKQEGDEMIIPFIALSRAFPTSLDQVINGGWPFLLCLSTRQTKRPHLPCQKATVRAKWAKPKGTINATLDKPKALSQSHVSNPKGKRPIG